MLGDDYFSAQPVEDGVFVEPYTDSPYDSAVELSPIPSPKLACRT